MSSHIWYIQMKKYTSWPYSSQNRQTLGNKDYQITNWTTHSRLVPTYTMVWPMTLYGKEHRKSVDWGGSSSSTMAFYGEASTPIGLNGPFEAIPQEEWPIKKKWHDRKRCNNYIELYRAYFFVKRYFFFKTLLCTQLQRIVDIGPSLVDWYIDCDVRK